MTDPSCSWVPRWTQVARRGCGNGEIPGHLYEDPSIVKSFSTTSDKIKFCSVNPRRSGGFAERSIGFTDAGVRLSERSGRRSVWEEPSEVKRRSDPIHLSERGLIALPMWGVSEARGADCPSSRRALSPGGPRACRFRTRVRVRRLILRRFIRRCLGYAAMDSPFIWWYSPRSHRLAIAPTITLEGLPRACIDSESARQRGS